MELEEPEIILFHLMLREKNGGSRLLLLGCPYQENPSKSVDSLPCSLGRLSLADCHLSEDAQQASSSPLCFMPEAETLLGLPKGCMDSMAEVNKERISNLGWSSLQSMDILWLTCMMVYHYTQRYVPFRVCVNLVYTTHFLSRKEVSIWLIERNWCSVISFKVPSLANPKTFAGLNVCFVYALSTIEDVGDEVSV